MHIDDLVKTIGAVIAACCAIGVAIALVKGSYSKARIEALRSDIDDYIKRLKSCEEQLEDEKIARSLSDQRVEHLEAENDILMKAVTQKADVQRVLSLLDAHHTQVMINQASLTAAINRLAESHEHE